MTRGSAPGTSISRAQSSGTAPRPRRLAASAGKAAFRSSVQVKRQLTRSSGRSELRSSSSRTSSSVAPRIASASFSSTVIAPLSAASFTAPMLGMYALADDLPRASRLEVRRQGRQAEVPAAVDQDVRAALGDGRDGERGIHAEGGRDDRRVDAVEALVAEDVAGVVGDAEIDRVAHAAAAEGVRRVGALRLRELHELAQPLVAGDLLHRRVGRLAHAD